MIKRISTLKSYDDYPFKDKENSKYHVDKTKYKRVLETFNQLLFKELVETGREITVYSRLGTLQLIKYKSDKKAVDINATLKNGFVTYHRNYHSRGFRTKFFWSKIKMNVPNKKIWCMNLVRDKKKGANGVAGYIKKHGVSHLYEK